MTQNILDDCLKDMASHISCALGCFLLQFTFYSGSCVTMRSTLNCVTTTSVVPCYESIIPFM